MDLKIEEETFIPQEKKLTKIIVVIVIILLVLGLAYVFFQNYYHNSKRIITENFDKVIQKVDDIKLDYDEYRLNQLMNLEIKNNEFDTEFQHIVNNTTFQIIEEVDLVKKISNSKINAKYQDNKFFNVEIYREQEKSYLLYKDLYDKYLLMEEDSYLNEYIEVSDLKKLLKLFIEDFKDEVRKQKFVREATSITINNQLQDVYNNSLTLKDNDVFSFYQTVIKDIQNNQSMMEILNKLWDRKANDKLNNYLQNLENEKLDYQLSIYTKKSLKQELIGIKERLMIGDETISLNIDFLDENNFSIKIIKGDDKAEITLYVSEKAINTNIDYQKDESSLKIDFKLTIESLSGAKPKELKENEFVSMISEEEKNEMQKKIDDNPQLSHFINVLKNHFVFEKETN